MSKAENRTIKYQLPDTVDPVGTRCYTVHVPDDVGYINAFFGALGSLANWVNWQRDDAHTAKDVAYKWRQIINSLVPGACDMPELRFRQPSNCELEYSLDGGTTWLHAGNFADCAKGKILDAIADGTIAPPSQQPAGGTIPANECHIYTITLKANQPWHSPNPVQAGYSVTVSDAHGGWSDVNTVIGQWACPDGTGYAFGHCGSALATRSTDPLPSVSHLRLIGYCNGVYMDMFNTAYTVPGGTPSSDFFLQANDDVLSDNAGEIQLTVTICNYSEWCWQFMGGHGLGIATVAFGSYDAVNDKIVGTSYSAGFAGEIQFTLPGSGYIITKIEENLTVGANPGSNGSEIRRMSPYTPYVNTVYASQTATLIASGLTVQPGWVINCGAAVGPAGQPGPATVNWVRIHGTGVNPFGSSVC